MQESSRSTTGEPSSAPGEQLQSCLVIDLVVLIAALVLLMAGLVLLVASLAL